MIVAGEQIDATIGISLGLSTMAAAGLGNALSDVFGVFCGGIVESVSSRLGLPPLVLTATQLELRVTKLCVMLVLLLVACSLLARASSDAPHSARKASRPPASARSSHSKWTRTHIPPPSLLGVPL